MDTPITSFEEFWPYYLSQHQDPTCRKLHFIGTALAGGCVALALLRSPGWLLLAPIVGYGLSWIGHFAFEKNRPAAFQHPLWSFLGDLRMFRLILSGQLR